MARNPFRRNRPVHRYGAQQVATPAVAESVRQMSLKLDDWQAKVFKYADIVPEVMTGYLFVQNTLDRVTFEIERFDRTTNEWTPDNTPPMQGIERRINTAFKAGRAAAIMHLVEETYILVHRDEGDPTLRFETLAPTEIRAKGKDKSEKRVMVDGQKDEWVEIRGDQTTIIRVFTPDPKDRNKASGPHKPLLGLLETMAIEMLRDQADAINVLAGNGLLLIPSEILPDEVDTLDASDTPGTRAHFENALEEAMVSTITDRSKGEAVVPITIYGQAEYLKEIRHLLPTRSPAKETSEQMAGYIHRYANDIDLPAEVIEGIGDANHWTGWKVDENTWAYHLEPRAQRIADALYAGTVSAIVRNLGLDPADYRLHPNPSAAIAKQDKSGTAGEAFERGAITPDAYVREIGMEPSDMRPDAEELQVSLVERSSPSDGNQTGAPPDRMAASTNPRTILRQAGRVANQQQAALQRRYGVILRRLAEDAARDGRMARRSADKLAAAKDLLFIGYNPGAYYQKYAQQLAEATLEELGAYLRRIATLTGRDYMDLKREWATEFSHRADAVAKQAQGMAETISKQSYGSGKPARIADNVTRALTSTASGGSNDVNGKAGNTQRPTHAGQDPVMSASLTDAVGSYATEYTWQVGHPDKPFHAHQELDGKTWFSWEEFDALDASLENPWLHSATYFPGDHDGCQCEYSIDFVPIPAGG